MPMKTIEGYSKEKYTNTSVLLAGGGAKALSDFIGSLSWDSTNKKIKYTPIGGSATDLVTLSWDNIANKPTSLPANGGDADTLDGQHGSRYTSALGGSNYITFTVEGDANTYYPVVITNIADYYPMQLVSISRSYWETAPDTWNTSTHRGGLTLTLLWNGSRYWDGNTSGAACYCVYKNETYSSMVGGLGNSTGGKVVWLRGGGAVYHIHSMNGTSTTVTVYTSTYTDSASQSFAPKTSPEEITVRWPGYANGADYASSAGSVAWGNVTEKPFNWSGQSGQPTWLWGSNDGTNYYVWNPSNFNVNYADSAGDADKLDGYHLSQITPVVTKRDFTNGTLVKTNISFPGTNTAVSEAFLLNVRGNGYGGGIINFEFQGYVYYTSSYTNPKIINSDFIIYSPNSIDKIYTMSIDNKLCFWWARQSYWQGFHIFCTTNTESYQNRVTEVQDVSKPSGLFEQSYTPKLSLTTSNYTSYLGYIGTTAVQASSTAQALTGITAFTFNGASSAGTNYITGTAGRIYFGENFHIDSLGSNATYINHYTSNNVYLVSGSSQGNVGIGTTSPSYKLHVVGDIYANGGWLRSSGSTGWYNESYGGGIYMSDSTYVRVYNDKIFYNSNTSQYAFYTPGGITVGSHLWGTSTASSWLAGQKEDRAVINVTNSTDANSFWPLIKWNSSSQGRWDTIGVLGNNLYFMSSLTSRTENSYDTAAYFDMTTSRLYSNGVYHTSYGSSAYALTSDGGVASIANMSVNYANSAGSVAWDNITGKPSSYIPTSHTHPYLPLSGGTLTGTLGKSNNYIFKPNGGDFRTTSNVYDGAICISLPANIGNTMLSMWIDVYNYFTNTSFSVHVGGYTYNSNFSNSPFAMVYGASHKVRLTYDNGFKIYIGETGSTWHYPQISIRDVVLGFNQNYSNWSTDWSVSFVTSFPTINKEITRYAITTDNIKDQSVNFATSATNASNIFLRDDSANSDYRLAFGTYNSSYASLYSSQYLTYNPYSGRLKLKGSKEHNSVNHGGSISFGDGDYLYMKEAKDDMLLQHYKGLVSDTQPIAIGFVGSCPSNSSASLVYKKSQPSAITVTCTRVSSGRFKVEVNNTSGKPIIAHLQVTPVRNYAQYEFAFAYIEDFNMDTADGGMEIASGSTGYFYVRTGRIHCQGTWAAGDYVATGDTGGFTGVVYAMINESLTTMPSTSW